MGLFILFCLILYLMMQIFDKKSLYFVGSFYFVENKLSKMHQKWSPLPAHVVKAHVDAAFRCNENIAELGVVVSDSENKIIAVAIQQTKLVEMLNIRQLKL